MQAVTALRKDGETFQTSGNVEAAKSISFNLDKTAPEITVTGVENGTYNNSLDVMPAITMDEILSRVDASKTTVTLDGNDLQQGAALYAAARFTYLDRYCK